MSDLIGGLDASKEVNEVEVRDAVVECFYEAHCKMIELGDATEEMSKDYCKTIVKNAFEEVGGDFENPTKEKLNGVLGKLVEMSKNFRSQDVIKEHSEKMQRLIDKLD